MDRSVRVFVNELCSADMVYCVYRHNEEDTWQIMKVDSSYNSESVLEAYENAKELKEVAPKDVPVEVKDLIRETVQQKEHFDSLMAKGREFLYVIDADGDTSYNFILYKSGEHYLYYSEL